METITQAITDLWGAGFFSKVVVVTTLGLAAITSARLFLAGLNAIRAGKDSTK